MDTFGQFYNQTKEQLLRLRGRNSAAARDDEFLKGLCAKALDVPDLLASSQDLLLENKGTFDDILERIKSLHGVLMTSEVLHDGGHGPTVRARRSTALPRSMSSKNTAELNRAIEKYERNFPPNSNTLIPQGVYNQIKPWWERARVHPSKRTAEQDTFLGAFCWSYKKGGPNRPKPNSHQPASQKGDGRTELTRKRRPKQDAKSDPQKERTARRAWRSKKDEEDEDDSSIDSDSITSLDTDDEETDVVGVSKRNQRYFGEDDMEIDMDKVPVPPDVEEQPPVKRKKLGSKGGKLKRNDGLRAALPPRDLTNDERLTDASENQGVSPAPAGTDDPSDPPLAKSKRKAGRTKQAKAPSVSKKGSKPGSKKVLTS